MAVNKVILVGNVGRDPEIRTMTNGNEVASFSLATTDIWKDKQTGERKDKTEWHSVVVFSKGLVEVIRNYVKKGSKLYIEGQLKTRKWTDSKLGIEKQKTEIVLEGFKGTLQMLGGKNDSEQEGSTTDAVLNKFPNGTITREDSGIDKEIPEMNEDDDIPF